MLPTENETESNKRGVSGKLISLLLFLGHAASSAESSQGLEKPGGHVAGAAEASPVAPSPAPSAKKPHTGKPGRTSMK